MMDQPRQPFDLADNWGRDDSRGAPSTGASTFLAEDWRGPDAPKPGAPPRSAFGKAQPLFLRARPASHAEELDRAKGIVEVAREAITETFEQVRAGRPVNTADLAPIINAIIASITRNASALPSLARLKEKHEYTYMHSVTVCGLMVALAQELKFELALTRDIGLAGLLHDIGKATVPADILDKPDALTRGEAEEMRQHASRGYQLLKDLPDIPKLVLEVCKHHHERPDGSGYPDQLAGEDLSVYVRMAAICDVYDALTSPRVYKPKWSPGEAIEYLRTNNEKFDQQILSAFVRTIGAFQPGVLVRLRSDRLGVILDELHLDPLHPAVAVFRTARDNRPISWQRVGTNHDPIIGIERPETWHLDEWTKLRNDLLALSQ